MINLNEKPFYLTKTQSDEVNRQVSSMSLEEKVGQLFCVLADAYDDEELLRLASEYNVGGVLFRPCQSEILVRRFAELDKVAKIPLIKAANLEEGGSGAVSDGIHFATQMQIGATNQLRFADALADACAFDANACGVNITFSPVADISLNYQNPIINSRAYGSDADKVSEFVSRYVKRIQSYSIASAVKHFPGDGVDYRDQHLHPTYNDLPYDAWQDTYGKVYAKAIDSGVMCVMAGHIVAPEILRHFNGNLSFDQMLPSTLSKTMLTDFLRGSLGFNGLIVSDATIMGGFCNVFPRKEAVCKAIEAGCDMLVFNTDFYEDYQAVLLSVKNSTLSRNRIDDAVTRILALKKKVSRAKPISLEREEILRLQSECVDKSITLVKNLNNVIPLKKYSSASIVILGEDYCDGEKISDIAIDFLTSKGIKTELFNPNKAELCNSVKFSKDSLKIYLANFQPRSDVTAVRIFWSEHFALDMPRFPDEDCVFISFGNPYHLQDVPRVKCYVNAYCATPITVRTTLQKLFDGVFEGISPIDPFCGLADTKI